MGWYKKRTEFINEQFLKADSEETKRLLAVGFIPASLEEAYSHFISTTPTGTEDDSDLDAISLGNFFALHPERIAGIQKAGTGFLNPILVAGNLEGSLETINKVFLESPSPNQPIPVPTVPLPTEPLPPPKPRPKPVSEPINFHVSTPLDKVPMNEETNTKNPEYTDQQTPEVVIEKGDYQKIKKENLVKSDKEQPKKLTVADTVRKYNETISEDEIKAWVYYKRRFGNPMYGWEPWFLKGGKASNVLLQTTRDTVVKDNKYADLRTIPANTILGAKTRFKNTYGTDTLVICKTPQGELLWVNTADVKEVKNATSESESEIDELVKKGALVFDGDDYYPFPVYFFGNIYEKINRIKENKDTIVAKYSEEVWAGILDTLSKYKPKLKSFRDPLKSNRPFMLCLSEFATDPELFGVTELNEEAGIRLGTYKRNRFVAAFDKVSLFDAFKQWMDETVKDVDLKNTTKSNINTYYFAKSIRWEKDEDGKDVIPKSQQEELKGNARLAAEELFSEFLSNALTFEDSVALDAIWNEKFNAFTSVVQFVDKVPVGFEGSNMFKNGSLGIKPAQRQGLAYLQLTGTGCLAYDVGFGKTLTGILNVAQLLSQGAIKRPLIVVPKPTYKNWLKELFGYWTDGEKVAFAEFEGAVYHYGVFSMTNVKMNDWYNLSGNHYKRLVANAGGDINKLVPENSVTVVSYKGFEQMGLSSDVSDEMFDSIARVILQKDNESMDAKEAAAMNEKIQGWLGRGNKNSLVDVDVCGFDHLSVDEAHNFKNAFPSCGKDPKTGRKLFGISASQSSRAVRMFFISNYIQSKHGKKVVLLTATPFTNSPLEIYSMLSYIGLDTLNQYNLFNIKKFFEQFVLQTIEYAIDAKGEIIVKPVIKSFTNLKLLQTILYNHFHYKDDPKEANVIRPCKIDLPNRDITTYLEMNDWQRKNQAIVKTVAKSVSRSNTGAVLKAINLSLDNAFSPFLFDNTEPESAEEFIEQSPKIRFAMECIRSVKEWHEARGEECSGQIIYSNRGVNYFTYIKQYLIENLGFKSKVEYDDEILSEVEIISGGGSEAEQDRKELVKDAFNAGIVKVIIGTSTIREGVNLQTRGTVLLDLYPEWNPTDILQLKGRIWRQGNIFGYVRFVMPLVINSMDNFINQKQDEKSKRIGSLWAPIGDLNIIENTADLDPAEIKYELVDDAQEKFKMKYDTIKNDMNREYQVLMDNQTVLEEVSDDIARLKDSENDLYNAIIEKRSGWLKFLTVLQNANMKALKEAEATRCITSIEKVKKNLQELLEEFGKYEANRLEIGHFVTICRLINQRGYDVYTGSTNIEQTLEQNMRNAIYGNYITIGSWEYKRLVDAYSKVRKAERSVLTPYGKSWLDDLSEIKTLIDQKIENLKASAATVESDEYKQNIIAEIEADMEAKRAIRGDLMEQVGRFASLNHLLSYLSDNTDKENCPIPDAPCCASNGIQVMYEDKSMGETPVEQVVGDIAPEPAPAPQAAPTMTIETINTRLRIIGKMLAKDPKNALLKTRQKIVSKMLEKLVDQSREEKPMDPVEEPKENEVPNTDTTVAKIILEQLGGSGRLKAMMGAYNFVAGKNQLGFKIKNKTGKPNYIKIVLNSMDEYDLEIGTIRDGKYKVNYTNAGTGYGFDHEQLQEVIEKETGMYMKLEDGGEIEEGKLFKVLIDNSTSKIAKIVSVTPDDLVRFQFQVVTPEGIENQSDTTYGLVRNTFEDRFKSGEYKWYPQKFADGGSIGKKYIYVINLDERGIFSADVRDPNTQESLYEINIDGDDDSGNIFEDGFMKNKDDISGLEKYMISLGILNKNDEIVEESDYEEPEEESGDEEFAEGGSLKPLLTEEQRESKIKKLIKKKVHMYELGTSKPTPHFIETARLADAKFDKRDLFLSLKKGTEEVIPYNKVDLFLLGETVELRDSKGEKYALKLANKKFKRGGRILSAIKRDRKYKSEQPHEKVYKRKTSPKNPRYKLGEGGQIKEGNYYSSSLDNTLYKINKSPKGKVAFSYYDKRNNKWERGATVETNVFANKIQTEKLILQK